MTRRFTGLVAKTAGLFSAALLLASCGGGGGSGDDGELGGTAARGRPLVGATVTIVCPTPGGGNTVTFTGVTDSRGKFRTGAASRGYPCYGTATLGAIQYRTVVFSGSNVNFTPETDLLAGVILAAAAPGPGVLTPAEFIALLGSDATFRQSILDNRTAYRRAGTQARRDLKIAARQDPSIGSYLDDRNYESEEFNAEPGDPHDAAIESNADVTQNADGSVSLNARTAATNRGNDLPAPARQPSGGTGGTGG